MGVLTIFACLDHRSGSFVPFTMVTRCLYFNGKAMEENSAYAEILHPVLHRAAATKRHRKTPRNTGRFHDQWPCHRMLEQNAETPPGTVAHQAMPLDRADHR